MAEINEIQVGQEVFNIGGSGGGVNYSTTEQDTGLKWIDGKPIYQKTIIKNNPSKSNWNSTPHNVSNIDTFIKYEGFLLTGSGMLTTGANATQHIIGFVDHTNVEMWFDVDVSSGDKFIVTISYTKTTDTPS